MYHELEQSFDDHVASGQIIDVHFETIIKTMQNIWKRDFTEQEIMNARYVMQCFSDVDPDKIDSTFILEFEDACNLIGICQLEEGFNRQSMRILKKNFISEHGNTIHDSNLNMFGFIDLCYLVDMKSNKHFMLYFMLHCADYICANN